MRTNINMVDDPAHYNAIMHYTYCACIHLSQRENAEAGGFVFMTKGLGSEC